MSANGFPIRFAVITVSDTAARCAQADQSGERLLCLLRESRNFTLADDKVEQIIVPDEMDDIQEQLIRLSTTCDVIITTGGTGFTPRDVTPEATAKVIDRRSDSVSHALLLHSLRHTQFAMLSRGISGIRGSCLIVNLPGSVKAVAECYEVLRDVLPHAVRQLRAQIVEVKAEHAEMQAGSYHHHHHDAAHHHHQHHQHHQNRQSHHPHHHHQHHQQQHHQQHHHHHHRHHQHEHNNEYNNEHDNEHDNEQQEYLTKSMVDASRVAERPRTSQYPMVSVEEALTSVLSETPTMPRETVRLPAALGKVLAEDIFAREPLPPFRASVKDGYAVRSADGAGRRRVVDVLTAGDSSSLLLPACGAVRVSTGGPVPAGADSVVQVEDTELVEASADRVRELAVNILKAPTPGQDVRPVGCDIAEGAKVLACGCVLGPCELGLLASVGCTRVPVRAMPKVGVASTGNELVDPFDSVDCGEGKIRDSNRSTLLALLQQQGFPAVDLGIVPDSADSLVTAFEKAIKACDVVVTTGGVSMGEKDLVKEVLLTDFNATIHFARVFMKPGKPTSFATLSVCDSKTLFFGLPGNPVSAYVTANLYVLPACRRLAGWSEPRRSVVSVRLSHSVTLDSRPEFHRCFIDWRGDSESSLPMATSTGQQMSSRLLSCQSATGLLMLPPKTDEMPQLPAGHVVPCMLIGQC